MFDDYLRKRASKLGAKLVNGLYMGLETKGDGPITIRYNEYKEGECSACCATKQRRCGLHTRRARWGQGCLQAGPQPRRCWEHSPLCSPAPFPAHLISCTPPNNAGDKVGTPTTLEVDLVIGADGANSRVAKDIDAGEYDYAIAFQVRGAGC